MGQIKVEKNAGGIKGLCVIEPTVHGDARGYFIFLYSCQQMLFFLRFHVCLNYDITSVICSSSFKT